MRLLRGAGCAIAGVDCQYARDDDEQDSGHTTRRGLFPEDEDSPHHGEADIGEIERCDGGRAAILVRIRRTDAPYQDGHHEHSEGRQLRDAKR